MQAGCSVYLNSIEKSVNSILREWRHLWPGGLSEEEYSTLNLMAHCRHGELGYNLAECGHCHHRQWYASSCGDRHCPKCLGPRQAKWSEEVCRRLPDCPHFHVVFTVPEGFHEFFEHNYRQAGDLLFGAAAETLKTFQSNNWKLRGAFFGVLHTWGRALNWHPHLHMLVSGGGCGLDEKSWKQARGDYLFPVRAISKVFRAIALRRLEALDGSTSINWPEAAGSLEERRDWRLALAREGWNVFSRPTLGNTRAVVRYLARYTSRIAMSNRRITGVDEGTQRVSFEWKDYRDGGRAKQMSLHAGAFLRRFVRHLVPKGYRRIRYFGLLGGPKGRIAALPGAPQHTIAEGPIASAVRPCRRCSHNLWRYDCLFFTRRAFLEAFREARRLVRQGFERFSLPPPPCRN